MKSVFGIRMTSAIWGSLGILAILSLAGGWMMLKKAGEKPWKILIPIYGAYCLYRIATAEGVFWGSLAVTTVSSIITRVVTSNIINNTFYLDQPDTTPLTIIYVITAAILLLLQIFFVSKLADAFGKGKGFAVGLFFLFPIFAMILGFGSAVYGGRSGLDKVAASTGTWKCQRCGTENPQSRGTCQTCGEQKQYK